MWMPAASLVTLHPDTQPCRQLLHQAPPGRMGPSQGLPHQRPHSDQASSAEPSCSPCLHKFLCAAGVREPWCQPQLAGSSHHGTEQSPVSSRMTVPLYSQRHVTCCRLSGHQAFPQCPRDQTCPQGLGLPALALGSATQSALQDATLLTQGAALGCTCSPGSPGILGLAWSLLGLLGTQTLAGGFKGQHRPPRTGVWLRTTHQGHDQLESSHLASYKGTWCPGAGGLGMTWVGEDLDLQNGPQVVSGEETWGFRGTESRTAPSMKPRIVGMCLVGSPSGVHDLASGCHP